MTEPRSHPLRGLLVAQFFGAFNDNAWKLVVALLAMRAVAGVASQPTTDLEAAYQAQTTWAFVTLTLPLMLFSLPAGVLADRVSKRTLILAMKAVEVVLMTAAAIVLLVHPYDPTWPLVILGLMGVQSALFSPAKYGILPEILPHDRLSSGNGSLEMWTFLAIIAGTSVAGVLLDLAGVHVWIVGAVLAFLSVVGLGGSLFVPHVPAARSGGGLVDTLRVAASAIRGERILRLTVIGLAFYWTIASLLGQDILVYAKSVLQLSDSRAALPLAVFGLGVGGGSLLAGRLSAAKVEYGLIPLGAIGLSTFTLVFGVWGPERLWQAATLMFVLGISSGLLVVPLHALLQWKSPAAHRGAVIALSNILVFGGILLGSLGAQGLSWVGLSSRGILVGASLALIAGTIWALRLLPDAFLRLGLVLLTQTFYRLRVIGREHVPQAGGALLVPNHVSFVDGLFILAAIDRPVRFLVESAYFHHRGLKPFLRSLGAIPIASSGGARNVLRALRDAGRYLDEGELVCIFAEGQLTRTGAMLPFRRGFERIVKGRATQIIPIHLDRVWGSVFSRARGRFISKWPRRIPYPVTISFGQPLANGTPVHDVRRAVQELGQAAWMQRKPDCRPLHRTWVRLARRHPFRFAMAAATRPRFSRFKSLVGAIALARALRTIWAGQERVGILLPPCVPGALVNLAAALAGRSSVNLNYTAGRSGMESAARQANLRTVVTSHTFIDKANLQTPEGVRMIWIEDVAATINFQARMTAFALALAAPIRMLERACGAQRRITVDDVATIIFSSGSTGEPKGVPLTHFNLDSNVEAVGQVFQLDAPDRILGILPLFHSFGYLLLWGASNLGPGIVFHPNPLDATAVGELVQRYRLTVLLATPTFLQLYLRRCAPEQFGSLRLVVAGAEKLSPALAQAFEDHFGIRPLEGYGTTECAPVVASNAPDFRAAGFYQPGSRRGTVGQPLPGIAVRVVDPDTFEILPPDTPGMLLVRGPNVMTGYHNRPDLSDQALRDGWYVTGDIVTVDPDGFITITDRLSRFAKIGGEMVPHGKVEQALHAAAESAEQVFAVTSIADPKKGERLAVLHTLDESRIPEILTQLAESDLPKLFLPRAEDFVKVESIPVLGTGKLDLRQIKQIAANRLSTT